MPASRLELLKTMVEENPRNTFARYGLATEHKNSGALEQAAEEFSALIEIDPDYSPAYFHGGQTLEKLGRFDQARAMYRRGVEVTRASGDEHAQSEMQAALALLE